MRTIVLTLMAGLLALTGCSGKDPTLALEVAKEFRHSGLMVAGNLYTQGVIDDALKEEIIVAADNLQIAINASINAILAYRAVPSVEHEAEVARRLEVYSREYMSFSELIMPLLTKKLE